MFSWLTKQQSCDIKPVVLLILDGFGIAPPSEGNAVYLAKKPNWDRFMASYPHTELIASGESVGLPANEVGNTEVGHLTMGAGRTMYQDLVRISHAIKDGSFYSNPAFLGAVEHVRQRGSKLHIMGLASTGSVHSSLEHLLALIELTKRQGIYAYYHLFLDGRDAAPQEGIKVIEQVQERLGGGQAGMIATLSGRYYAMDRDRRWERTQAAYEAIVEGRGEVAGDPVDAVRQSYVAGVTDEFVKPTVIVGNSGSGVKIDNGDGAIFFNFRVDRPKQLTAALVVPQFESMTNFAFTGTQAQKAMVEFPGTFERQAKVNDLYMVTMTEYHEGLPVSAVAFAPEYVVNSLPQVVSDHRLKQLKMSESEKERFVTYYFDGMQEQELPGVTVRIVPSPKVATYDLKPEMSVYQLSRELERELKKCKFHLAVVNFANPDMVAHTGKISATVKAIEHVDKVLEKVEKVVKSLSGLLIITADHGNAEEVLTYPRSSFFYTSDDGGMNTEHSNNLVPVVFVGDRFAGKPTHLTPGALVDIAPTILTCLGIPVPSEMTGRDLLAGIS